MTEQTMIERVALAIESAQIGYSINLTRLVDGVSTYECQVDGVEGIKEFDSYEDALAFVTKHRRSVQGIAAIKEMREPTDSMVDVGMTELATFQVWRVMIDAALAET